MHLKQWSLNQEQGTGENSAINDSSDVEGSEPQHWWQLLLSVGGLSVLYCFLSLALGWALLRDTAVLRFSSAQSPSFKILCCLWEVHPYADTWVWVLASAGFSALSKGAWGLVLVLWHGRVSSSVSWDGRVSRGTQGNPSASVGLL